MTHQEKVFVFVIGTLQDLCDLGVLEGGMYKLSPEGYETFLELKATEFRPTEDELRSAMAYLQSDQASADAAEIWG